MRVFDDPAKLAAAAGEHLGYSDWTLVDQPRIGAFATATGDDQWIHIDPARAAGGPFGTTIAHGYLTLSLIPALSWQIYRVEGVRMASTTGSTAYGSRHPFRPARGSAPASSCSPSRRPATTPPDQGGGDRRARGRRQAGLRRPDALPHLPLTAAAAHQKNDHVSILFRPPDNNDLRHVIDSQPPSGRR